MIHKPRNPVEDSKETISVLRKLESITGEENIFKHHMGGLDSESIKSFIKEHPDKAYCYGITAELYNAEELEEQDLENLVRMFYFMRRFEVQKTLVDYRCSYIHEIFVEVLNAYNRYETLLKEEMT